MISVWNPRRVSRAVGLLMLLLGAAVVRAAGPVIVPVGEHPLTLREESWLKSDRRWLAGGSSRQAGPMGVDPFTSDADSLLLLRGWVQGQAAREDSLPRARPLASRLQERWQRRGYLEARVVGRDTLRLDAGPRYHFSAVEVGGETFPGRDRLLEAWLPRPGEPYEPDTLAERIDGLLLGAGEVGYPFTRWVTQDLDRDPGSATVRLQALLMPGRRAVLGPITGTLSRPRANRFLARATGLNPGDPFRHSDLERAVERLQSRGLYSRVDTPRLYLTTSPDTIGVLFPVREKRKVNRFQVVLGLSRGDTQQPSRLSGEVAMDLPNLAGTGRALGIGWRDDGNQKSYFGFSYLEPLAFGTPLDTEFILDNEVQREAYTRLRLDNRWRIPVVAMWGVEFGLGWDRTTYPTGALARTGRVRGRGAVLHYRGDAHRSGWSGQFALETAYRSSTPRVDEDGQETAEVGQDVKQQILSGDLSGEWWVSPTLSLFGRAGYRQITGNDDDVPLSEQFRFGGAATLRGYREDEFHGTRAAWTALELRIGRAGGSRLYTFYDLGYFEFSALDPLPEDPENRSLKKGWPRGYGLGILARTPGGDISLAIGFPGTVDFEQAKLHVTLMESF